MEITDWDMESLADDHARRRVRKRNHAFRQRLREYKQARESATRLRVAGGVAAIAWICAGLQLLR